MATTPPIPFYNAVADNPLNGVRDDVTWGTIEMQSPRIELIYSSWTTALESEPTDHPLYAFSDWSRIQTWAAGYKETLGGLGYDNTYTGWLGFDHWERLPLAWEWLVYQAITSATHRTIRDVFKAACRSRYSEISRMTAASAEAAYARLYNRCIARMHTEVIRQIKSLCPSASYLFYENMCSAFPDDENDAIIQDAHDRVLAWLWPQLDAKTISIYQFYKTAETPGAGETTVAATQDYLTTAITEAARVATANGLQCFTFVWDLYHDSNATYGGTRVQDADLDLMLQSSVDSGADGVIFWHSFGASAADVTSFNAWTANNLEPVVAALDAGA